MDFWFWSWGNKLCIHAEVAKCTPLVCDLEILHGRLKLHVNIQSRILILVCEKKICYKYILHEAIQNKKDGRQVTSVLQCIYIGVAYNRYISRSLQKRFNQYWRLDWKINNQIRDTRTWLNRANRAQWWRWRWRTTWMHIARFSLIFQLIFVSYFNR